MTPHQDITIRNIISKNIKELRKEKYPAHGGQIKCAGEFGTTPQQWAIWEMGRNIPSDENQRRIADFFGISVAELRGEAKVNAFQSSPGENDAGAGLAVEISRIIGRFAALQERIHLGRYESELVKAAILATNELLDKEAELSQAVSREDKGHSAG